MPEYGKYGSPVHKNLQTGAVFFKRSFSVFVDSLNGLYNRSFFETEFERASKGKNYPVSVVVADLDGLKGVNDSHGHAVGDCSSESS
ncbi:MAG: diguanylate cyclase [Desulfuromonadales bacterium]|nr:diguanylate cyclase [Desulfuromonadales bacterium]